MTELADFHKEIKLKSAATESRALISHSTVTVTATAQPQSHTIGHTTVQSHHRIAGINQHPTGMGIKHGHQVEHVTLHVMRV